jgi:outer membrane protein OmpA-like peptidoglycan-associated protein
MSSYLGSLKRQMARTAIAGGLVLTLGLGFAVAQSQPSSDQILNSLTPKHTTRSLSVTPEEQAKQAEDTKFINDIKKREVTRSLSVGEREKVAVIAKDKPKIDLEINFEFNSDKISKSAMPTVDALAKALNDQAIKGSTFMLAGYTDAKGSEEYNQELSERRAAAVKKILTEKYGIAANDLMTTGYGKTHLKDAGHPYDAANRRVGVVNMQSSVAGK